MPPYSTLNLQPILLDNFIGIVTSETCDKFSLPALDGAASPRSSNLSLRIIMQTSSLTARPVALKARPHLGRGLRAAATPKGAVGRKAMTVKAEGAFAPYSGWHTPTPS